jgi:hypothetical protein
MILIKILSLLTYFTYIYIYIYIYIVIYALVSTS